MKTMTNPLRLLRYLFVALAGSAILLATAERASATEELRKELAEVAKGLSQLLKSMDETTVSVGQFTGPPTLPTSAGPTFTKMLSEELTKLDMKIALRSKYGVKGEYLDVINASTGKLAAQIKGELVDRQGNVLTSFNRGVDGTTTLASLFGLTAELPVNQSAEVRDEKLQESLDKPKVFINEAKVAASEKSPYAIEILILSPQGLKPRPAVEEEGLAFCAIGRDEIYAVRVHNNSPFDASVSLTIDGMSVFAFSEFKEYTHYIIPAGKPTDILGWHRNNQKSDSFKVVAYADSEVAKALPNSTSVGTITAVFRAAWDPAGDPPPDEPRAKGAPSEGTARGPEVEQKFTQVVRQIGKERAAISIRYSRPDAENLPPGEVK
jgi:hypothetical protein